MGLLKMLTVFPHISSLFPIMRINEDTMHPSIGPSANYCTRRELSSVVFDTRSHAVLGDEVISPGPSRPVPHTMPLLAPHPGDITPGFLHPSLHFHEVKSLERAYRPFLVPQAPPTQISLTLLVSTFCPFLGFHSAAQSQECRW